MTDVRFEKVMQTIDLAVKLQSTRIGMTIKEIAEYTGDSIRTTQRLMQTMEYYFPQLDILVGNNNEKRYRISNGTLQSLLAFSLDELTALEAAAQKIELSDFEDDAQLLRSAAKKIKASMKPKDRNRVAPDLESLLRAEGLIASPGPHRAIPADHVATLRDAIISGRVCEIDYTKRDGTNRSEKIHPYGFLYGHRHYLVAYNPTRVDGHLRKIILASISRVQLTDEIFEVMDDFSLQEYSRQSFGVFFDRTYEVEWEFSEKASPVAREFIFHPTQSLHENADGTLTVRFVAAGLQEMAWHLAQWGADVKVVKPEELKIMVDMQYNRWEHLP